MTQIMKKLTPVTKKNATAIDHIFINSVTKFKTGILKLNISNQFSLFFGVNCNIHINKTKNATYLGVTFPIFLKMCTVSRASIADYSDANNTYHNVIVFLAYFMAIVPQNEN